MLVLSRKRDERVVINGNIEVTVVEIRGDRVRLGFDAPKEIEIHRREVQDAIYREEDERKGAQAFTDAGVRDLEGNAAPLQQPEA